MILQPIHQERVLPAQFSQQYLPPVTVDTTEVHKLIEKLYSKTIVLPPTHTVEVSNYVQTPQGLIRTDSGNQTITPQPSLIQSMIQTQMANVQPPVNPVIFPQNISLQPLPVVQPNISVIQQRVPIVQQTLPIVQQTLPIVQQTLPLVQQTLPISPPSMILQPINTQSIIGQPLITQSALLRPLSATFNASSLMRPYI